MQKVLCPRHEENTPSCAIYDTHAFCYAGCGRIELEELKHYDLKPTRQAPPEDIDAMLAYIEQLPVASVRGLLLPVDSDSYYIRFPGVRFFKRRKFIPGDGPKYLCPRGHKKPLFSSTKIKGHRSLAIVEGEINALSLSSIDPPFDVCSPGGAEDIRAFSKCLDNVLTYYKFYVIVDKDGAGLQAAKSLKTELLKISPHVVALLLERDCNELLMSGELSEKVKEWTKM